MVQRGLLQRHRFGWILCYGALVSAWTIFLGALGNRNELLVASIAGVLLCYSLGARFGVTRTIAVAFGAFFVLRVIEASRGADLEGVVTNLGAVLTSGGFWNPLALATGTESLAAHMSLYGILSQDLDFTYGSSLLYLANSALPRLLNAERVPDSYTIYAAAVGAPETQGFTIHYAAGWYLNLGLPAVVFGAALLALIWGWLYRVQAARRRSSLQHYLPALVAFCFCSAYAPALMRGGPEGLKSLLVEGILIPYVLARVALRWYCGAAPSSASPTM